MKKEHERDFREVKTSTATFPTKYVRTVWSGGGGVG